MLNVNDLVEGVTRVRILELPRFVEQKVGDVGTFDFNTHHVTLPLRVVFEDRSWHFKPSQLEIVDGETANESTSNENVSKVNTNVSSQSEDLIIYKSRWNEIIEGLNCERNRVFGMTDEEVEIVQSVLKTNIPFSVIEDPVIVDIVIEKENQTHLDATHIGDIGNFALYYKSEVLKRWFWWNDEHTWEECEFEYANVSGLFPITISKAI